MSGHPSNTWRRLLAEKREAIVAHGQAIPINITSEDAFRDQFEALCRYEYHIRLLVKLTLGPIDAFASAVDAAFQHESPNTLAGLVFGGLFVAFQVGPRFPLWEIFPNTLRC